MPSTVVSKEEGWYPLSYEGHITPETFDVLHSKNYQIMIMSSLVMGFELVGCQGVA